MFIYQCECCGHESSRMKEQGPDGSLLCNKCLDMRWCKDCESWVDKDRYFDFRKQCFSCFEIELYSVDEMDYD